MMPYIWGECKFALYLNGSLVTDLVIPEGVTAIGDYAFSHCRSLTSVAIPDSVTSIGYRAFDHCNESLFETMPIPGYRMIDGWVNFRQWIQDFRFHPAVPVRLYYRRMVFSDHKHTLCGRVMENP